VVPVLLVFWRLCLRMIGIFHLLCDHLSVYSQSTLQICVPFCFSIRSSLLCNKAGELIENMLTKQNLICVNDCQPTRRNSNSVIDVGLMSSEFPKHLTRCNTHVSSEHMLMSVSTLIWSDLIDSCVSVLHLVRCFGNSELINTTSITEFEFLLVGWQSLTHIYLVKFYFKIILLWIFLNQYQSTLSLIKAQSYVSCAHKQTNKIDKIQYSKNYIVFFLNFFLFFIFSWFTHNRVYFSDILKCFHVVTLGDHYKNLLTITQL
jgi:hypothetical protein